ncbi:MAG TPA: GNAT family N-acetyltransferase [Candidatus Acidoferrales bacterium]|nr:GNAT family N-acetyltransferase [Candidatus Acidoferrales bacterium]
MTEPSPASVQIRLAESLEDVARVAPLFDAYRVFYRQPSDLAASYAFLAERWQRRETVLFFATVEDANAGFVQLFPSFSSVSIGVFWILNDLFVDSRYRKHGIGGRLMQRAEQHAHETGAIGLTLSTAVDNFTAQALYRSQGYVRDEEFLVFNRYF